MRISPWAYLIIGFLILVVSYALGEKMILFIYLGIAMAVFGGVSLFILRAAGARRKKVQEKHYKKNPYSVCPHCGSTVIRSSVYCPSCGNQLRNI